MSFTYLYVAETVDSIRTKIVGYAQAGGLIISNWIAGAMGQQILEVLANTAAGVTTVNAKAIRGFASLDTSVDPGDVDPYDPSNQLLPFAPGFLSDKGSNDYGTERIGSTFATGAVTFNNAGTGAANQNLPALSVTFQRNYANADGSVPTFRNGAAITCSAGVTLTGVPIIAETAGSAFGASPGTVTILVSTLPGVTVTNPSAILGTDLQLADDYRAACREAAALTSPNGPADAYRYLATTGRDDGTWGNSTTGNSLGIVGVYVSAASSSGIVNVYYKGASGGAGLGSVVAATTGPFVGFTFVQAANFLIANNPSTLSVFDAITFTGLAASDVAVPITYSLKMAATAVPGSVPGTYTSGGSPPAPVAAVFAAIDAAYGLFFEESIIGGEDQVAGAGVIYTEDLRGVLYRIQLTQGVNLPAYAVAVTTPGGSTTALALGQDATYGGGTGTLVLV